MSPKHQERAFPRAYSRELIRIATADHESASYLLTGVQTSGNVRPENAAYLFQQAIEKALKSVLCAHGEPVPMVHDLGVLVAKMPDTLELSFGYELAGLDEYATVRRYEEGRYTLQHDELDEIQALSERVLTWARQIVDRDSGERESE